MSTEKVCDRCRAILKINTTGYTELRAVRPSAYSIFKPRVDEYDLCDDCMLEFRKFLSKEETT